MTASPDERVVLVDESDRELGVMEKLAAHVAPGHLHRAFSVLLIDPDGRVLLQRRAATKHHFRSLWANSYCSHPRPGESLVDAGRRRAAEELGIPGADIADLEPVGHFVYRAEDPDSGLVEHELDWVLVGRFDGAPDPHPAEVDAWRWVDGDALRHELAGSPDGFAPWAEPVLRIAGVV